LCVRPTSRAKTSVGIDSNGTVRTPTVIAHQEEGLGV
jgi:hypothetical protein